MLADFNSVVLAGCPSKYGTQFVTWDRDFDHKGVSHGHYYTGLYASGNYEAAKRDFATRSGLIPEQQVFREEKAIQEVQEQIEQCLPELWGVSSSKRQSRHRNRHCNIEWQGRSFDETPAFLRFQDRSRAAARRGELYAKTNKAAGAADRRATANALSAEVTGAGVLQ